jgi:carbon storage regulator CsrA
VSIAIVDCNGGSAKLGISAPKHIAIYRDEIFEKINAFKPAPQAATLP